MFRKFQYMKKIYFPFVLMSFIFNFSFGQVTFQKTYGGANGEAAFSVQQTNDGGYIILGTTYSFGNLGAEIYLIKTNYTGDTSWVKTFGTTGTDAPHSVQQTTDGGYIIAGETFSFPANNWDIYLLKTDFNGNLLWSKKFGGPADDYANSIQQTHDKGYIIAGSTNSFGADSSDAYLIKTDSSGTLLWSKTFGGPNYDNANSVAQTTDRGYIMVGNTYSFSPGHLPDIYLIRTDSTGTLVWSKTYGGTNNDFANAIQQTNDGGFIFVGNTISFMAGGMYLIKTDNAGNLVTSKMLGASFYDDGFSVQQTNDNGYILLGQTNDFGSGFDIYLIKTDSTLAPTWSKIFGGPNDELGYSLQQTNDHGYILAGTTYSYGFGDADIYVIKTDSLGNSFCHDSSVTTPVITPATQVSSPATIVSAPTTITTAVTTIKSYGGIITSLCFVSGINQTFTNNSFSLFPNPASSKITIDASAIPQSETTTISITNNLGEVMRTEKRSWKNELTLDVRNLSAGMYFVTLQTTSGIWQQKCSKY